MSSQAQINQNSLKPGRWVRSTCKMCLHSCTSLIHVTDAGIVNKIEGDPTNPSNLGKLWIGGASILSGLLAAVGVGVGFYYFRLLIFRAGVFEPQISFAARFGLS